jgi:hypothetical protein
MLLSKDHRDCFLKIFYKKETGDSKIALYRDTVREQKNIVFHALYQKLETNIPRNETALPRSPIPTFMYL